MHSCVTIKNVKWCHLIWPILYIEIVFVASRDLECPAAPRVVQDVEL